MDTQGVALPCAEQRIAVGIGSRALGVVIGTLAALLQWGLGGFFLTGVVHPAALGSETGAIRLGCIVMLACVVIVARRGRRVMRQAFFVRPALRVHAGELEISHPLVLREHAVVPLKALQAVSVDEGTPGESGRFPVAPEPPDKLWTRVWPRLSRRYRFATLAIDTSREVPNTLLLFDSPQNFRPRTVRGFFRMVEDPRPGRRENGLLLRVRDPQATAALFRRHGVRTQLVASDLAP